MDTCDFSQFLSKLYLLFSVFAFPALFYLFKTGLFTTSNYSNSLLISIIKKNKKKLTFTGGFWGKKIHFGSCKDMKVKKKKSFCPSVTYTSKHTQRDKVHPICKN